MTDTLVFRLEPGWEGPVVRLRGEIDLATLVEPLRERLLELDDAIVTIDFCDVTFMDSTGVNVLVQVQQRARARGGKLVLYGVQPAQMRVLNALGIVDYFDCIVPD